MFQLCFQKDLTFYTHTYGDVFSVLKSTPHPCANSSQIMKNYLIFNMNYEECDKFLSPLYISPLCVSPSRQISAYCFKAKTIQVFFFQLAVPRPNLDKSAGQDGTLTHENYLCCINSFNSPDHAVRSLLEHQQYVVSKSESAPSPPPCICVDGLEGGRCYSLCNAGKILLTNTSF